MELPESYEGVMFDDVMFDDSYGADVPSDTDDTTGCEYVWLE